MSARGLIWILFSVVAKSTLVGCVVRELLLYVVKVEEGGIGQCVSGLRERDQGLDDTGGWRDGRQFGIYPR